MLIQSSPCCDRAVLDRARDQSVRSSTRAAGPLVRTEVIPLLLALRDEYISLRPMGSPLRAMSTKYGWLLVEVRLSNRASISEFFRTELMPVRALAFRL